MGKKNARQRMTRQERDAERATERALLARDAARHPEDARRVNGANRRIVEDLEHRYYRLTPEDVMVMVKRADGDIGGPSYSGLDESVRLQRYMAQQNGGSAYARAKKLLREERPDLWQALALAHYHTLDRDPTIAEVADRLRLSKRTVEDRIARATRLLRAFCEDRYGVGAAGPDVGVEGDADPVEDNDDNEGLEDGGNGRNDGNEAASASVYT
jgi:hypothetical protein